MSHIVVVVLCDAPTPQADGFVNRNTLVVESLRRDHHVTVLGIAPTIASLLPGVDDPFIEPTLFESIDRGARLRRIVELRVGRAGFNSSERRLAKRLHQLDPDVIVALTYRRGDLVRAMRDVAPTVFFAEEQPPRKDHVRSSRLPAVLSPALERAQRDVARGLPAVAVLTDDALIWSRRRFQSPSFVVPHGFDHAYWSTPVSPDLDAGPWDVVVVANLRLERNASSLLAIVESLDKAGWPDGLRIVAISAAGYVPGLEARAGDHLRLVGGVADPRPFYAAAAATLVPSFSATGIKNGIIQGWGTRCPVVTTPAAAATVGATSGIDVLIGESPDEIAELLRTLPGRDLAGLVDEGSATLGREFSSVSHDQALRSLIALVEVSPGSLV